LKRVKLLLAECYANACIASEIARELSLEAKVRHDVKMGRDKVLKKISALHRELGENDSIIAVIDYEMGPTREFIDRNFEFRDVMFNGTVYVGIYKRDMRVVAVIFNPYIEEFICKVTGKYCKDGERGTLKHGSVDRVCRELSRIYVSDSIKQISRVISSLLEDPA